MVKKKFSLLLLLSFVIIFNLIFVGCGEENIENTPPKNISQETWNNVIGIIDMMENHLDEESVLTQEEKDKDLKKIVENFGVKLSNELTNSSDDKLTEEESAICQQTMDILVEYAYFNKALEDKDNKIKNDKKEKVKNMITELKNEYINN